MLLQVVLLWGYVVEVMVYWHCSWTSVVSQNFWEWATGWCHCGCVLPPPFQPNFQSIEMYAALDMIKCTYLFYEVFPAHLVWVPH